MSLVSKAIEHMQTTGNIREAVEIALGKRSVTEAAQTDMRAVVQTQTWHCPNENAVNQLVLLAQNKLGIKASSIEDYVAGSQGGYAVTFTGEMADHDIASLANHLGCYPLAGAHQPGAID